MEAEAEVTRRAAMEATIPPKNTKRSHYRSRAVSCNRYGVIPVLLLWPNVGTLFHLLCKSNFKAQYSAAARAEVA